MKQKSDKQSLPSFDKLTEYKTLLSAWRVVSSKGSCGGIDGMSINDFEKDLGSHLGEIRRKLIDKEWSPQPYKLLVIIGLAHHKRSILSKILNFEEKYDSFAKFTITFN